MGIGRCFGQQPSLRARLIALVCSVTLLPFLAGQFISARRLEDAVGRNFREQSRLNLQQTEIALDATLASYEDFLYQLYTDDVIVELVNRLVNGVDEAVSRNQLRREIQGKAYAKPNLQAITLIFSDGTVFYYDKLTASVARSSWLGGWDAAAMYDQVSTTNRTHYFPSAYVMDVSGEPVYLFHMAHRLIDYRNIRQRQAIVVISMDESLLFDLCNEEWSDADAAPSALRLLVDGEGRILSGPRKGLIGQKIVDGGVENFVQQHGLLAGGKPIVEQLLNAPTGWTLYQLQDQSALYRELAGQQGLSMWIMLISVLLLVLAITLLIRLLTRSIGTVTDAMQRAGAGDLAARVPQSARMPRETAIIARRFNAMMDEMGALIDEVREASKQQRDAEIAALEAQLNPHFLYNTLDTINWMAIDNDEYDISNAISALARILRYGIDGSGRMVTVGEEVQWLKQYLSLQQIRLKNSLDFHLEVEPEALQRPIHKLLFQPFVENAIIHGFEGVKRKHALSIAIRCQADGLNIRIADNGKGMGQDQVRDLFQRETGEDRHRLGVRNALERIHMYYGGAARVEVHSRPGEGTVIDLLLPVTKEENL